MNIAEGIKSLIEKSGLTQKEFAEKIGVSSQIVSEWIRGKKEPRKKTRLKIAEFFKLSGKDPFSGAGRPASSMDRQKLIQAVRMILEAVGEDPGRRDLLETPARVAEMYEEILFGIRADPRKALDVVLDQKHEEIVLLKDIPLYSLCEHHLIPFVGRAHVAYIPKGGRVTGLSKIARVVEILSCRLQVQERLTTQIANIIMEKLEPLGVMVVLEAEHLCMSMRGIKKPGITTVTSAVRGVFKENEKTRMETLFLIRERG
jgi:GTP cyclohydrolase I